MTSYGEGRERCREQRQPRADGARKTTSRPDPTARVTTPPGLPRRRRARRRRRRGGLPARRRRRWPPAPVRSRSTPSAPPATATASGPTWSSCAGPAPAPADRPVGCPDLPELSDAHRRRRVGAARGQPGPALPGRDRHAPAHACSTPSSAPGWPAWPRSASPPSSRSCSGLSLAKEHSAVDWSTRPLPEPWLRYAALDVEVLVDAARRHRTACSRSRASSPGPSRSSRRWPTTARRRPATDPWRRTSGMHRVRSRRQLASVRALWQAREQLAQRRDISPGRLLPDAAIVAAADGPGRLARRSCWRCPASAAARPGGPRAPGGRRSRPPAGCPTARCRPQSLPSDAPPPARAWADKRPGRRRPAGRGPGRAADARRERCTCRSRTSCRPTASAGSCGPRPGADAGRRSPRPCRRSARGPGRSSSPRRSWPAACTPTGGAEAPPTAAPVVTDE